MDVLERIENGEVSVVVGIRIGMAISPERELRDEIIDLAKLGQQMQWVSVVDQKPEHKKRVWVLSTKKQQFVAKLVPDKHNSDNIEPIWEGQGCYYSLKYITHWMPLPPNPGEQS